SSGRCVLLITWRSFSIRQSFSLTRFQVTRVILQRFPNCLSHRLWLITTICPNPKQCVNWQNIPTLSASVFRNSPFNTISILLPAACLYWKMVFCIMSVFCANATELRKCTGSYTLLQTKGCIGECRAETLYKHLTPTAEKSELLFVMM